MGTEASLSSDCILSLPSSLLKRSPGNIVLKIPVVWGTTGRNFCKTPSGTPLGVVGVPTKGSLRGVPAGMMGNTCMGERGVGVNVETGVRLDGWIIERVGVPLGLCKSILIRLSASSGELREERSVEK